MRARAPHGHRGHEAESVKKKKTRPTSFAAAVNRDEVARRGARRGLRRAPGVRDRRDGGAARRAGPRPPGLTRLSSFRVSGLQRQRPPALAHWARWPTRREPRRGSGAHRGGARARRPHLAERRLAESAFVPPGAPARWPPPLSPAVQSAPCIVQGTVCSGPEQEHGPSLAGRFRQPGARPRGRLGARTSCSARTRRSCPEPSGSPGCGPREAPPPCEQGRVDDAASAMRV